MRREEIAESACVSPHTLNSGRYLRTLIESGKIHIKKYVRNTNGPAAPIYASGPETRKRPPAPPKAFTAAEKSKRWKERTGYNEHKRTLRRVAAMGPLAIAAGYRINH